MSSTNKTTNLKLNKWIGSDKPKREDFVYDNEIIDTTLTDHMNDSAVHITEDERSLWNTNIYTTSYLGNGSVSRTVDTLCPFSPSAGIIFAASRPSSITDFDNNSVSNCIAFFTQNASSTGVTLASNGTEITVKQSAMADIADEYSNLNETGVTYICILFR